MNTPPSKPCEEMTVEDFIAAWRSFLENLRVLGHRRIGKQDGILTEDLHQMWDRVLGGLIERVNEIALAINLERDREMLCKVIRSIGTWDPTGPTGEISTDAFLTARMIKEAVERWLGPRLSSETNALLKALNQLLCMLHCL